MVDRRHNPRGPRARARGPFVYRSYRYFWRAAFTRIGRFRGFPLSGSHAFVRKRAQLARWTPHSMPKPLAREIVYASMQTDRSGLQSSPTGRPCAWRAIFFTENRRCQARQNEKAVKRVFGIDVSTCIHCGGADLGQYRRTRSHPRHPRPLRKARCTEGSALPAPTARPNGRGRVVARSATPNNEKQQPSDAATIPQGRAWPDAGIQ